jgi:hypothetical protein
MRQPPDTPARAALHSARRLWHAHTRLATGALLFALALALRLYRLGAQSLWLDEGGTWAEVTGKGWGALLADLISPNAAYPLYHLLLKAWVGLAGDSEWALRFPSALAGAAAVVAVYLAAHALSASRRPEPAAAPLAGLLCATAPFALWQAQDAKVYSLLLLCAALLLWALLRALQRGTPGDWLALLLVALVSIFVHRLALLAIIAALLAVGLAWPFRRAGVPAGGRWLLLLGALLGAVAAIAGIVRAVGIESRGGSGHVPAGPLTGLWLTLAHFALDRGNIGGWLGLPLLVWALPALALTLWGLALLARDAWRGRPAALAIVCMFAAPLLLFAAGLAFARLFESRYATVAFPAWLLVVLYPLIAPARQGFAPRAGARRWLALRAWLPGCYTALLVVHAAVLLQPQHGLFSGAPVKEDWRSAIMALARCAHPDDLLILHPYYVEPMWRYYAPRVTPDPLPQPVRFDLLGQGYCRDIAQADALALVECYRRSYEEAFNRAAQGRKRMLMLIAPEHARTIDPPKTLDELRAAWEAAPPKTRGDPPVQADTYGMLGLRFQYAKNQRTWPCGGDVRQLPIVLYAERRRRDPAAGRAARRNLRRRAAAARLQPEPVGRAGPAGRRAADHTLLGGGRAPQPQLHHVPAPVPRLQRPAAGQRRRTAAARLPAGRRHHHLAAGRPGTRRAQPGAAGRPRAGALHAAAGRLPRRPARRSRTPAGAEPCAGARRHAPADRPGNDRPKLKSTGPIGSIMSAGSPN